MIMSWIFPIAGNVFHVFTGGPLKNPPAGSPSLDGFKSTDIFSFNGDIFTSDLSRRFKDLIDVGRGRLWDYMREDDQTVVDVDGRSVAVDDLRDPTPTPEEEMRFQSQRQLGSGEIYKTLYGDKITGAELEDTVFNDEDHFRGPDGSIYLRNEGWR